MDDLHTEITTESYFSRLGGSLKGILTGLLIFIIAFPLLFWNEGRAVKRLKALEEGAGAVISVPADSLAPGNAGKLIHVTGLATTDEVLQDSVFGVSAQGLVLSRRVAMYQWQEKKESKTKKNTGGSTTTETTYRYTRGWSTSLVDSSSFKRPHGHKNPANMPYESQRFVAQEASFGAFRLTPKLVERVSGAQPLTVTADSLPPGLAIEAKSIPTGFYVGLDPSTPQIGDVRVTFEAVLPKQVSVVGRQTDDTLASYVTKGGGNILLFQTGTHSAEAMFASARNTNRLWTWILRFVGFLLMALGLGAILKPLSVLTDVLPVLGNVVGTLSGFVVAILAGAFSLATISVAWLFYRPLLGLVLLAVAVACPLALKLVTRGRVEQPSELAEEAISTPS